MIKTKKHCYFISELLVKEVFKKDNKYYVRLITDEVQEIDEMTYYNLGGK